jgi:toxin YoeB
LKLIFSESAWDDYLYWQKMDKKLLKKVNELIQAIMREPFTGIGKPEPLKYDLSNSAGIPQPRIVYKITDDALLIAQCRSHY